MARIGYTLMTEQSGPASLVQYARGAERHGFDFALCSDHYSPWLASQGHAPYAWTVLGAVAEATQRLELATFVTYPIRRYHPVVVAQKAATLQLLSEGRFILGLGSGENLNEHVLGTGWPPLDVRQEMLREAVEIIRQLFSGSPVTTQRTYFNVSAAQLWDCPEQPVPIAVAVSGARSIKQLAPVADHLITTIPQRKIIDQWRQYHPAGGRRPRFFVQLPICWAPDEQVAVELAHDQFRWSTTGWSVNAELPTTDAFAAATAATRPEDIARAIPCGPDLDRIAQAFQPAVDAGFTDIGLVQVGDRYQHDFLEQAAEPLIERLRNLRPGQG